MSKIITFGEIMLRLMPPGFSRITETRTFEALYAGGEANVAASLACYNQQTEFVSRVPANDLGDACIAYLRQHGIGTSHILRGGDRLGIYFLEAGAAQRGKQGRLRPGRLQLCSDQARHGGLEDGVPGRRLVSLDGDHAGCVGRRCAGVRRGYRRRPADGDHRLMRPELPRQALEMGQEGRRGDAGSGSRM